ncbi:ran exchange factor prp20 [Niveomyces insectorum RCEF 264]|uniref:Ran exchange factor prp20 n=1 Tax=Niveomyces insectorum RCEF 264 TaxID=1081102 RepID=A0A167QRH7_9HYPO|nr:ran exchange factor prp20 [Niveomyces insectorum RCEF 264]
MPPRKAAAAPKRAAATTTAAAKKAAAAAAAASKAAAQPAPAKTAAKRKRGPDDDEDGVTPVVNGVAKTKAPAANTGASRAKKPKTAVADAAPSKKTISSRANIPVTAAAATDAENDKENAAPAAAAVKKTTTTTTKKRPTAAEKAAAAPSARAKAAKAKATATKAAVTKRKAETAKTVKAAKAVKTAKTAKVAKTAKAVKQEADKDEEETREVAMAAEAVAEQPQAPKKTATRAAAVPKKPLGKIGVKINEAPTQALDIFVFGEGTAGELGLGSLRVDGKLPINVKRPRLNPNLAAATVGVVQIATGGMHAIALTKDNKVLTWGVNDQGALGRDTAWDGGYRDADKEDGDSDKSSDDEDEDDDTGLNPRESTPGEIDTTAVIPGTKFVQVVASDSASFALTEDGRVYGWGTFRASDGILGFSREVEIQRTPVLLPEPRKITALATGSNHILALDAKGKLFTWGCPEQNQLGRRCVQRDIKASALRPGGVGFRRGVHIDKMACGSYHSFALDSTGHAYAWGLNNFGQIRQRCPRRRLRHGRCRCWDATVLYATPLGGPLAARRIVDIDGGEHHSLACTDDGTLYTWGRIDGKQLGLPASAFTEASAIYDERGEPRILRDPTAVPGVPHSVVRVSAGTDNSFALTADGAAYSWGFSGNYQTGQGPLEEVLTPLRIDNSAVKDRKLVYAGAGGQFSILASVAE